MITRYRAWLDDSALDEIADSIYILDIQEAEPDMSVVSLGFAGRDGSMLASKNRLSLQVHIRLQIREYDTARRKEVLSRVLTWAQGETLTISDRPGQRLGVTLDAPPSVSSLKWTETLTLTFTARDMPFWRDSSPEMISITGTSATGEITLGGNRLSCPTVYVTNKAATAVNSLTLTIGETKIQLESLNLLPEGILMIVHVVYTVMVLMALDDNPRVFVNGLLTDGSSDYLSIPPNEATTVTVEADAEVAVTVVAQGVWM